MSDIQTFPQDEVTNRRSKPTMADTITITDPDLAKMFESAAPTMGDVPRAVCLGRTEDGRTRKDFETEDDFEYEMLMVGIEHATIDDVSAHLAYQGMKARAEYVKRDGKFLLVQKSETNRPLDIEAQRKQRQEAR